MTTNIIQHHEPFDFETFYQTIKAGYINIDYRDFTTFMNHEGEKHSFMGRGAWKDRIEIALGSAIASDEAVEIINRATLVMITIVRSPEADRPLLMEEMQFVQDFISGLPPECDVVWGITDDSALGNEVKAIILVNAK